MKANSYLIIFICFNVLSFHSYASSRQDVLFIGDSQTEGALGGLIYEHLKKSAYVNNVHVYGVGSSSPRHWQQNSTSKASKWLQTRTARLNNERYKMIGALKSNSTQSLFKALNNRHQPQLVIFQFLGNSMGKTKDFIIENVQGLLSQLNVDQNCLYISSPPYYINMPEKNKKRFETQEIFLEAIGSRCLVMKGMSEENMQHFAVRRDYYLKDRIHLTMAGAQAFFKQVQLVLP